jgi:putative DNA-invertase from lambdoid prophage Rac
MSRAFIYARVSIADQNTGKQIREIEAAGSSVSHRRTVDESISGSVAASDVRLTATGQLGNGDGW